MKFAFIIAPFLLSHGKEPKGKGCWAFSLDKDADSENIFFTKSMTFGAAKKEAKKRFLRAGSGTIYIYVLG